MLWKALPTTLSYARFSTFLSAALTTNLGLIKASKQRRDPWLHGQSSLLEKQECETMLCLSRAMERFFRDGFPQLIQQQEWVMPTGMLKQ